MGRNVISSRAATRSDAALLAQLWTDQIRRADPAEQLADIEMILKQAAATPEERLIVVEYDAEPVGAVLLRLTTVSALNLEPTVEVVHPRVLPSHRRKGVGRALMDAATTFAAENGVVLLTAVVPSTARDANRFMARLGLAQAATWRVGTTSQVRSRVSPAAAGDTRALGRSRVLAARRSARRSRFVETVREPELGPPGSD